MDSLTDAYNMFAASAMTNCVFARNVVPLASAVWFAWYVLCPRDGLVLQYLAILGLLFGLILFMLLRYGPALRARSPFCQQNNDRLETKRGSFKYDCLKVLLERPSQPRQEKRTGTTRWIPLLSWERGINSHGQ